MDHQIPFCSSNSKTQRKSKTLPENSFFFIHMKLISVKEIPTLQKHHWHAFSHKTKRDGDDWSWNKQWV
jgi:hypothetical protein